MLFKVLSAVAFSVLEMLFFSPMARIMLVTHGSLAVQLQSDDKSGIPVWEDGKDELTLYVDSVSNVPNFANGKKPKELYLKFAIKKQDSITKQNEKRYLNILKKLTSSKALGWFQTVADEKKETGTTENTAKPDWTNSQPNSVSWTKLSQYMVEESTAVEIIVQLIGKADGSESVLAQSREEPIPLKETMYATHEISLMKLTSRIWRPWTWFSKKPLLVLDYVVKKKTETQ